MFLPTLFNVSYLIDKVKELTVTWTNWEEKKCEGIVVGFLVGYRSNMDYAIILHGSELVKVYLKDITVSKYGNKKPKKNGKKGKK